MNSSSPLPRFLNVTRGLCIVIVSLPSLLSAHPGQYHPPDETDEFDSLRAMFFHSHGTWDYFFAAIALTSLATAVFAVKRPVKVGALLLALGSLIATQLV